MANKPVWSVLQWRCLYYPQDLQRKRVSGMYFIEPISMLNILACDDFTLGQQSFLHSMQIILLLHTSLKFEAIVYSVSYDLVVIF